MLQIIKDYCKLNNIELRFKIMATITKAGTVIKIKILQNSDAVNYFETQERLFLENTLSILENNKSNTLNLNEKQISTLESIFEKYKKITG